MDAKIKQTILEKLHHTETSNQVKIPLAIESGSRGWGFAATNADYDCRFIYAHTAERYLSVFEPSEFIEYEVDETYDIKGYDLKRVLKYIVKSQATIFEWLSSNVIYVKDESTTQILQNLAADFFNPIHVSHHYLSLARKMLKEITAADEAKIKKYFYILRPIANLNYIHQNNKMPFMEYDKTLEATPPPHEISVAIQELKERKMQLLEHDKIHTHRLLVDYFCAEVDRFERILKDMKYTKNTDYPRVDEVFRALLKEIWK